MNKKKNPEERVSGSKSPSFRVRPEKLQRGDLLLAAGKHWPLDAILFRIGKNTVKPQRILKGTPWNQYLVPDADGNFLAELGTAGLEPGSYVLEAFTQDEKLLLKERLIVEERKWPGEKTPRAQLNKHGLRMDAFNTRRFDTAKGLPEGVIDIARVDWERIHGKYPGNGGIVFFSAPVHGGCNWMPMGPAPFSQGKGSSHGNNSGRICSLAIHPILPSVMYIGTAAGGVWKTADAGLSWVPKTDDKFTLSIGALAIDPVTPATVYAGTGEYIPDTDTAYYGNGLLKSTNSGNNWSEIGTVEFTRAEIARIVIDPADTNKLYVAGSNGVWESTNGGGAWAQLAVEPATDVILVHNPAVPGTTRLFAGFSGLGVFTATNTGMGWSGFSAVSIPGAPAANRMAFGVCRTLPQHIYIAFSANLGGNMLAFIARSSDYGGSWTPCTIPDPMSGRIYQAFYNLAIQPHPTDPETVLLGVVDMFKSIDGGGSWTNVSYTSGPRVHPDCHAIAFSPSNPNHVFVGCDGGLFYSPDLTNSWQARNQDISTIQLYDLGQHPQYDAIMIAGSQDNGGFHYNGAPIWKRSWVEGATHNAMDGDAVVATIDPFDGMYHYYGTGPEGITYTSDNAGRLFNTFYGKPPGSPWWTPFFPDPRKEGVLYIGGTTLVRSTDRGTSWTDISTGFPTAVRSIGFHPSDLLVLYVGTLGGTIYRIQGPPMGVWDTMTVTRTDVTYTGLPVDKQVSSLAVDPAGNVWASFSSLLEGEDPGEFSNQHVFRLDAGMGVWVEKSSGLAIANPVNTLVIDPMDATKVYCGADRGVFAWDAVGKNWTLLDQGLPNAPVMLLKIHQPSRKLRAATFGRGVWERHLNAAACTDYYLYMRNHIADAGSEPGADGVADPYLAGRLCWHWQSPDIIVDPAMQTPMPVNSALELYDNVLHYGGRRGSNRVYITVHNKGPFRVTNVRVRVFFAPASGGLPGFPAGLLANPFTWVPGGPVDWNPVGPAFPISEIEPGTTRLAQWPSFVIPMSAPQHSCLMAFVTSDEDAFNTGGITNPDELVVQNRMVALKNLDLDGPAYPDSTGTIFAEEGGGGGMPAPAGFTNPREMRMNSTVKEGAYYQPAVFCAHLPADAVLIFATDPGTRKKMKLPDHKDSASEKITLDEFRRNTKQFNRKKFDLDNVIVRDAKKHDYVYFGDVHIDQRRPVDVVVWVWSKKWKGEEEYTYDLLQQQGRKSRGGFTVRLKGIK